MLQTRTDQRVQQAVYERVKTCDQILTVPACVSYFVFAYEKKHCEDILLIKGLEIPI